MQFSEEKNWPHITEAEAKKRIEEMNLIEGFLFDSSTEDPEDAQVIIKGIVSLALNRPVKNLIITSQKQLQGIDSKYHGIRLDTHIYQEADGEITATVYDVEMENRSSDRASLPKRFRYYTSLSDSKFLESGHDYTELPDFISITILSYDPFGEGDIYYNASTRLNTHPDIPYEDGISRIYLYCNGKVNDCLDASYGKRLQEVLKYIVSGVKPATPNKLIEDIDNIVSKVKSRPEVTISYMQKWDREEQIRREAIKATNIKNAKSLIEFGKSINASDEAIKGKLLSDYDLTDDEIKNLLNSQKADSEILLK